MHMSCNSVVSPSDAFFSSRSQRWKVELVSIAYIEHVYSIHSAKIQMRIFNSGLSRSGSFAWSTATSFAPAPATYRNNLIWQTILISNLVILIFQVSQRDIAIKLISPSLICFGGPFWFTFSPSFCLWTLLGSQTFIVIFICIISQCLPHLSLGLTPQDENIDSGLNAYNNPEH